MASNSKRITNKQTAPSKAVVTKPQSALASAAAVLSAAPVAPPVVAKTVALRGGQAVANIKLSGTAYRTAAPHNAVMWSYLQAQLAKGPVAVATVLQTTANPQGVPGHFVGYALRRGYLQAV